MNTDTVPVEKGAYHLDRERRIEEETDSDRNKGRKKKISKTNADQTGRYLGVVRSVCVRAGGRWV